MARAGVNYADILKAAEYIQHNGHLPTVDRVREYLGTGSKSTIAPLLKQWHEQNATDKSAQGLPQDLLTAVKSLCDRVQHQADNKIKEEQNRCNTVTDDMQHQLTEALTKLSQLKGSHSEIELVLKDSQAENQSLSKMLETSQRKIEKTTYQLDEKDSRIAELKAENNELRQESKDIRAHFEHYQQHMANDKQRELELFQTTQFRDQAQIEASTVQIIKLTAQLANEIDKRKGYDEQIRELSAEVQKKDNQLNITTAELTGQRKQLDDVVKEKLALESKCIDLQIEMKDLIGHKVKTDQAFALLQQAHQGMTGELKKMEASHLNLQNENRVTSQEKSVLQGQYLQLVDTLSQPTK